MDQVWLAHTKILVEDCEDAWAAQPDVTCTQETGAGLFMVGAASAKIAVADAAASGQLLATEDFAAKDLSTATHIGFWIRSDTALAAGALQFHTDESATCGSPDETLNVPALTADEWQYVTLAFAAATTTRNAVVSVGFKMSGDTGEINFYVDDVQAFDATQYTTLSVRGLTRPDDLIYFPPISELLLDGTIHEDINGFRRRITLDLVAINNLTTMKFLNTWARADVKHVMATNDDVRVVLEEPEMFSLEWLGGFEEAHKLTLTVLERSIRTADPVSWGY